MAGNYMEPELPSTCQKPTYQFMSFQPSRSSTPHPESGARVQVDPKVPPSLHNAVTNLSLRPRLCPHCKGRKYNFTAYFHNNHIFHSPPHHLLGLVEKSYILKNSLQSLLITYVLHGFEEEFLQSVRRQIEIWGESVDVLVDEVVESAEGFQVELGPLGDVKTWTKAVVVQMWEHVFGVKQIEIQRGCWGELILEFRKLWELVWLGYLQDQLRGQWARDGIQQICV